MMNRIVGLTLVFFAHAASISGADDYDKLRVGGTENGRVVVPTNQVLSPAGRQVDFSGRPTDVALSPDGRWLAVLNSKDVLVIDPETAAVVHVQRSEAASYTGILFSRDGKTLYASILPDRKRAAGMAVFQVLDDGKLKPTTPLRLSQPNREKKQDVVQVPATDVSASEIPAGICLTKDGKRLLIVLNLSNRLVEWDLEAGKISRAVNVGSAPYGVVVAKGKAYVSNWGGPRPKPGEPTGPAGRGTPVVVNPRINVANQGSVSVIDLDGFQVIREIEVGQHASGLAIDPQEEFVFVANANSDTVSVVATSEDQVVETISTRPSKDLLFGSSPNAIAVRADGKRLYVSNGTNNAVAVIEFEPTRSRLVGAIPTGWYPAGLVLDSRRNTLYVANIKGIGSRDRGWEGNRKIDDKVIFGYNAKDYRGSVSLIPIPADNDLATLTNATLENNRLTGIVSALAPARPDQPPRPVPQRHGEPSVFKHVLYIIKENRTYDQVFGDLEKGAGDPSLCLFGEQVTPNHHKLAREFVLLDNFYCCGSLSATGHQWTNEGYAVDYLEKAFAGFPRSYPYDGGDAMAYSPTGFVWDNVLAHQKTLRVYGEFVNASVRWKDKERKGTPTFTDCFTDYLQGNRNIEIEATANIETLKPYLCKSAIGFPTIVPDVHRAGEFIKELKEFEKHGNFPNFMIMLLPNDHTSGTRPGLPTPKAAVADNDLALGQVVEAVSKSKFWKETCILVVEDDPQNGFDHIDGHRTIALAISPYTKRGVVDSTNYNQTSMLRTIELILGLPPMNQLDASATAMSNSFTDQPDFTPYEAVPNNIPLDQLNPALADIADPRELHWAKESIEEPLDELDEADEDTLNRILWYAVHRRDDNYPAWAINSGLKRSEEAEDDDD
ncbi:MAG: alkaline phosphatase family protein [Planctomycetota bacterium]